MAVTEVFPSDPSMTFSSGAASGQGGVDVGTWLYQHDGTVGGSTGALNFASGGGAQRSSTGGDSVVCTLPAGTRAVYLNGVGEHSTCDVDMSLSANNGTTYAYLGRVSNLISLTNAGAQLWRYPRILLRHLDPNVNYKLKLVVVSGQSSFYLNSLVVISGNLITPIKNRYGAMGDSWTAGVGASAGNIKGYAMQLSQMLRSTIPAKSMIDHPWTFDNFGVSGDAIHATGTTLSGKIGGFTRLWQQQMPVWGDHGSLQFGPNDLGQNGVAAGEYGRNLVTCLSLIEDCVDVKKMVGYYVGTPGWVTPDMHVQYQQGFSHNDVTFIGDLAANYEQAVDATYEAVAAFPWATVVPVFEAMDRDDSLLSPNAAGEFNGDFGLHPSDSGHARLTMTYYGAARGQASSSIAQGGRFLPGR